MDGNTTEAERWLSIAEKLLATRDLHGTRTFAIRARESAPILADQILAVTDTLLTAQSNPQDWYGILQLVPLTQSMEVVASQYRKLALLLNPGRNRLSFADQAFRFVSEAWNVLSNPSKKAIYDNELRFLQFGQVSQLGQQQPQLQQQQQPQTQTLFMQPEPPPAPKETQTLFMQTPQKETPTQVTQPLFTRRSPRNTDTDGNAALEGGGQLGLNNKPPEQNRPAEPIWRRQMNQIGLAGTSQVNRSVSVGSSQISQLESTQTSQVNRPEPIHMTQINQTGTDSSSQFNRAEPTRTDQINQTTTPHPRENNQTQPTSVTQPREATESEGLTFWTACPYCYVLYEYPKLYEDCTLRCQTKNCRKAFHGVVIPSPPVNGKDMHFSCWGFFPLGFSRGGNFPSWSPISTMYACPNNQNAGKQNTAKKSAPRVYYDDVYEDVSDSIGASDDGDDDDDDWRNEKRKKAKNAKGKGSVGRNAKKPQSERVKKATNEEANVDHSGNLSGVSAVPDGVPTAESSRRGVVNSGRKQMGRGAKNLGKLDLNVEFSNEVEEPVPRRNEGNHAGYGEEDNIEGNGFFEGLDEFLNSLPILSAVGDDKVKAT
ncbi:EMF1-Interacting Protein 9, SUVH1/3-interacting DNAJ domain-containing protein 1 [Hibiscus trionum]|uniref:EMF1-Interacting Protein 9, SUVH1/3-interacting DNAJ domain-containing protein 1 n=1 Tax=Hibiscus trionum TaxID=183268 RepID=A0A9W7HUM3_HIBTR|nr:EMF1-Interacting Protein 9, SUVH1/3-interacting DNAJ domain-containing protein 1 [Hibiscus trionum]